MENLLPPKNSKRIFEVDSSENGKKNDFWRKPWGIRRNRKKKISKRGGKSE